MRPPIWDLFLSISCTFYLKTGCAPPHLRQNSAPPFGKSWIRHCWYPCFGLLVTSPLDLKSTVGSLIRAWWRCYTIYLEDISPFYGATDTSVLDFWWCLLWVPNPEWSALFTLSTGVPVSRPLRFNYSVTPADLMAASMAAEPFPHHLLYRAQAPFLPTVPRCPWPC